MGGLRGDGDADLGGGGGGMCSGKVLVNSCRHMMADGSDAMTRQDVLDESA